MRLPFIKARQPSDQAASQPTGAKAARATALRLPAVSTTHNNKAYTTTWTESNAISAGMKASSWIYRALNVWGSNLGSLNWYVEELASDGHYVRIDTGHPIEQLLTYPTPIPYMTGTFVLWHLAVSLGLTGNALCHIVLAGTQPAEIWPKSADTLKPIRDAQEFVSGYEYTLNGKKTTVPLNQIIHCMLPNPGDYYWGLSPLQAATKVIDTDKKAIDWNHNAVDNRILGDVVISPKEYMSPEQWDEVTEALVDKTGTDGARSALSPNFPIDVKNLGFTAAEIDYMASRRFAREEIGALFGVPAALMNDASRGLFNNETLRAAYRVLWGVTLYPLANLLRTTLDRALVPFYDETAMDRIKPNRYRLRYELPENIDSLLRSPQDEAQTAQIYHNMGIPFNFINDWLELGYPNDIPGADQPKQQGLAFPAATLGAGTPASRKAARKSASWSEEQRASYWRKAIVDHDAWEARITREIAAAFRDEAELVRAGFLADGQAGAEAALDANLPTWTTLLRSAYQAQIEYFAERAGAAIWEANPTQTGAPDRRQHKAFSLDPYMTRVTEWAEYNAALKAKLISYNSRLKIASIIAQGISEGQGMDSIAWSITGLYDSWFGTTDMTIYRASVIARTETAAAANFGNQEGARQAGEQLGLQQQKTWISSRDERVRDSHTMLDGETVPLETAYSNGLMFPGDPEGPGEEVIQCRCVEAYETIRGGAQ